MANRELSKQDYLNKAEAYCARAEHCAAEVRRKLYAWGAPDEINDEIVETLYANTFLNDERFCRAYVHDKLEIQHWGRMKIRAGLSALQTFDHSYPRYPIPDALFGHRHNLLCGVDRNQKILDMRVRICTSHTEYSNGRL